MELNQVSKKAIFVSTVGVITGCAITLASVVYFVPTISAQSSSALLSKNAVDVSSTKHEQVGLPIRFKIPILNIDASVERVGITAKGAMAVPKGPSNVAWFELGRRPGEKGSAVVAGHYGWKNGMPAVFDGLSRLRKGDKIYVIDEKGATTTFAVTELRLFSETDDASVVFDSRDGKAHLNLITCDGVWNKSKKSYSNRLVVFTDKQNN